METDDWRMRKLMAAKADIKADGEARYLQQSHERLRRNIETKIRTTMIGSLAIIEEKLGILWGQGKPRSALTDQEMMMEKIKDDLRNEILNNGNNQIRSAVAELNQYEVKWTRYQYNLNVEEGTR